MRTSVILKAISVLFILLQTAVASSQNLNALNPTNIIPPSPEVAALAKYITMPVSYATGVPAISLPIYTIKTGDLALPVSLSYNASGIKVEETATWVGLGFSLNAGGTVSRIMRGLPDDYSTTYGFMHTALTVRSILSIPDTSPEWWNLFTQEVANNVLDVEPDIFLFNVMGYSGRFYYSQDSGRFLLSPYQNITINYNLDVEGNIKSWVFTLPNGVKCYFGESNDGSRSATERLLDQATVNVGTTVTSGPPNTSPYYVSSWPVMEIVTPTQRAINFYYATLLEENFGRGGEGVDYKGNTSCDAATNEINASFYKNWNAKPYLQSITTDLWNVSFIRGEESRLDMAGDSRKLDSIIIRNNNGKIIKGFAFDYDYFQSTDQTAIANMDNNAAKKRLYLKTVSELDNTLGNPVLTRFYYNTSHILPSRLSASQDYWGYYNGKNNGTFLTPKIRYATIFGTGSGYTPGADRTVDTVYAKACMLTKVEYPTGGSTEYTYESNKAVGSTASSYFNNLQPSNLRNRIFQIVDNPFIENNNVYVDSFEVTNVYDQVKIQASCQGCTDVYTTDCPMYAVLYKETDLHTGIQVLEIKRNEDYYFNLPNGKYKIEVTITPTQAYPEPAFSILMSWTEQIDLYNMLVGGLRVRKIVSHDGTGNTISRSYGYNSFNNNLVSSGELYNVPVTVYKAFCPEMGTAQNQPTVTKVVSTSALPLASDNGQIITYTNVTEFYDQHAASFKTEYTFSTSPGFLPESGSGLYPFAVGINSDWRSGLLLEKNEFEKVNASLFRVVRTEKNIYKDFERKGVDSFGFKWIRLGIINGPVVTPYFYIYPYSFVSEWYLADSSYSAQYSYSNATAQPDGVIENSTKNYYNSHYLIASTRTINSKGQIVKSSTWYPFDYNDVSVFNINTLLSKGIIDIPVKQEVSINGKIKSGTITQYNDQGQPDNLYAYESAVLSDTVIHNRNIILEDDYELKGTISYDGKGNPIQIVRNGDIKTAYIWDYSQNYAIAEIRNAGESSVAYTSFEADASGKWNINSSSRDTTDGITGRKCYQISNGSISRNSLNASTEYILTYWTKNGSAYTIGGTQGTAIEGRSVGDWKCYMHRITGVTQLTISGSGLIDELRLYPKGAQMTTYTYEPLIGITSQCDIGNRIVYYEYDGFGRLKLIRDQDKNILKTFDYKYQANTNQ